MKQISLARCFYLTSNVNRFVSFTQHVSSPANRQRVPLKINLTVLYCCATYNDDDLLQLNNYLVVFCLFVFHNEFVLSGVFLLLLLLLF